MKKLFILFLALSLIPFSSYCQYGMNISGQNVIVHADTYLIMDGNLLTSHENAITIKPNAFVTTKGNLSLTVQSRGLVIESNATGTGSYIVNGNVSHSGYGSAKVQSYISGSGAGTQYYMHFVSAPVEDTTTGYVEKVRLQQFDMTDLHTYAFDWDASVDTSDAWVNIWPDDHPVDVGNGLTLSNYEVGPNDMIEMVGYPVAGSVTYSTSFFPGNELELLGNPFPSAIDFDAFADSILGANKDDIFNKYWIYDPSIGNYVPRVAGIGGSRYIQVGQGFFVQTRKAGSVVFLDSIKSHSNDPFREIQTNLLMLKVEGGTMEYEDKLYIRFTENATEGFDKEIESKKWNSINSEATMIRSIAEDETELAINCLPIVDLNTTMTTVPVHFECGENAEYTFTFNGIESFDMGTEVWLEDVQMGNGWTSISLDEFQYQFTGSSDDPIDRFNIHFFGPTYIPEDEAAIENNSFKIYASKNHAYILNNTQEVIKNVSIHNLMGQTIYQGKLPQQTLNKIYVSGQTGYYVVHVETNKNIYAEKVLILK